MQCGMCAIICVKHAHTHKKYCLYISKISLERYIKIVFLLNCTHVLLKKKKRGTNWVTVSRDGEGGYSWGNLLSHLSSECAQWLHNHCIGGDKATAIQKCHPCCDSISITSEGLALSWLSYHPCPAGGSTDPPKYWSQTSSIPSRISSSVDQDWKDTSCQANQIY